MNLVIHNRNSEASSYRHKKFDQGKRPRQDDNCLLGDKQLLSNKALPFSVDTDSSDSTNFDRFARNIQLRSISPTLKKPKLIDTAPEITHGLRLKQEFNDSGFSSTPQKFFTSTPGKAFYVGNDESSLKAETASVSSASTPPPSLSVLPNINEETLRKICKYHGNMVRQFPKKQRSPEDQERRNKNTLACRISRRVKKLEHIALEEQYKEFTDKYFGMVQESIRATAYLSELTKLIALQNNAKYLTPHM